MSVVGRLAQLVASTASRTLLAQQSQALPAVSAAANLWLKHSSSAYHTSASRWLAEPTATASAVTTPQEKYAHLADKDIWDEAWAYEPRFGTADNPIQVPALLSERIIGVTDPEDDTLVIWGIIREGEPPKQLVAGGEFFVLKKVDRVEKVGDKLNIPLTPNLSSD